MSISKQWKCKISNMKLEKKLEKMIIDIEIMYLIYFSGCFYILSASMMQTLMP